MKKLLLFSCYCLIATVVYSQNCGAPSTGLIPINDLGSGTYNGWTGGLYPGGSNYIPAVHKLAGLQMASQIQCLDANGNADPINGKIVWLSIGMSNTTLETQQFIPIANAFSGKNPKLTLVDGAVGAMPASYISTPSNINYATYWSTVATRLSNAGVTANQVEVIWLKEANPVGTVPVQEYYDSLVVQYKRIMHEVKTRFPNVKICYFSSRISARYATSTLNPEPHSYWTGWAIKKVIEDQINGDVALQFSGTGTNAPWMAWGSYMWSDGSTPQTTNPNVFWVCPTDFNTSDGTHPSTTGAIKVANLWLNFLSTDSTATPWFMGAGCNLSTIATSAFPSAWTSRGVGGGGAIVAASISPFNSNEFFMTCDMSNLFHTTDFGQNYSMIPYTQLQVQLKSEVQFTSNPSKLFVLNRSGVYIPSKSYDGGINWTNATNPCTGSAYQLFASPHDTDQVVISDVNKIYFSNTANTIGSYSTLFNYPGLYGGHIAGVYFENKDSVYICSHDSLIYTFNGGGSWLNATAGTNGIPANEHIISFKGAKQGGKWVFYCVTIQANALSNIYNSSPRDYTQYRGIYKLSQGQTQWNSIGGNLPNPSVDKGYLIGMANNDTSVVYIGGSSFYIGSPPVTLGAIFKSTDGGNSFVNSFINAGNFNSNSNVTTGWIGKQALNTSRFKWNGLTYFLMLSVDPNNSSRLLCGDQFVAHSSIDQGANWQQAYTDVNYDNAPSVLINQSNQYKTSGLETTACYWLNWTSPTNIFACYNDILARRSIDGGNLWSYDIYGLDSTGGTINDVNMTISNPLTGRMYAAVGEQPGSNADYTDARILLFRGRISVSADSGKTWITMHNFSKKPVTSLAFDKNPANPNGMYATVIDVLGGIGDVYYCADVTTTPNTWTRRSSPPRTQGRPLQIIVLNKDTLVAVYGTRNSASLGTAVYTASSGVFYSTDGGLTWADNNPSFMQIETVNVEIDPNDLSQNTWLAFVGTKTINQVPPVPAAPGVYRSTNRGVNWINVYNQSALSGTFHPTFPNELYICTELKGLQYATNTNSNSFDTSNVASYPFRRPQKIFFNPYNVNEVWAASFGNGFRVGTTSTAILPVVTLSLKLYIEGMYLGNALMQPIIDPIASPALCDTVEVSLALANPPYTKISSVQSVLQTDGTGLYNFQNILSGSSYYIVVRHRNSLETWSKTPITINTSTINFIF